MLRNLTRWGVFVVMVVGGLGLLRWPTQAQEAAPVATCPQIVQEAIAQTRTACQATDRNEACYGNEAIQAQPKPDVAEFNFAEVGDIEALPALQALRLSPLDEAMAVWGLARMDLQASLPDGSTERVTLILFGEVDISDAAAEDAPPMSAFTFQSGFDDAPCAAAPESGILVQTPEGVGRVQILVNQVVLNLGTTVFLQTRPDGALVITVLDGEMTVTAGEDIVQARTGQRVIVNVDADGQPLGPPEVVEGGAESAPGLTLVAGLLPRDPFAGAEGDADDVTRDQDEAPPSRTQGTIARPGSSVGGPGLPPLGDPPPDAPNPNERQQNSAVLRVPTPTPGPGGVVGGGAVAGSPFAVTSCTTSAPPPDTMTYSYNGLPPGGVTVSIQDTLTLTVCTGPITGTSGTGVAVCGGGLSVFTGPLNITVVDALAVPIFTTSKPGLAVCS